MTKKEEEEEEEDKELKTMQKTWRNTYFVC